MKELPYVEEIYDMETGQLEALLRNINDDMANPEACEIPDRFDGDREKYQRKCTKLKEYLELELEERGQVDNVLNFFLSQASTS